MNPGLRASGVTVTFVARSRRGGQKIFVLPAQAELQSLTIDGVDQPIRQERQTLTIPIVPGRQTVGIAWHESGGISWRTITPKFDLGVASVNPETVINMPADRWTLFVSPALLGPAVLFWGLLLVFALVAFALGQVGLTPHQSLVPIEPRADSGADLVGSRGGGMVACPGMAQAARPFTRGPCLQNAASLARGFDGMRARDAFFID